MPRPAPVMTATRPSKRRSASGARADASLADAPVIVPDGARGDASLVDSAAACASDRLGSGGNGQEAEQAAERAAHDGSALVVGHVGELGGDELLAAAEGSLGGGIVVAPHDGRNTCDVAGGDGHRVVL